MFQDLQSCQLPWDLALPTSEQALALEPTGPWPSPSGLTLSLGPLGPRSYRCQDLALPTNGPALALGPTGAL